MADSTVSHDKLARRGLMFILSSPSGAGKTTISRMLLDADDEIKLSVSVTTRPPRTGEIDGVQRDMRAAVQERRQRLCPGVADPARARGEIKPRIGCGPGDLAGKRQPDMAGSPEDYMRALGNHGKTWPLRLHSRLPPTPDQLSKTSRALSNFYLANHRRVMRNPSDHKVVGTSTGRTSEEPAGSPKP